MEQKRNLFDELKGKQLSSVVFVQDYLQLEFDGNTLTLYVWPRVHSKAKVLESGDINYRNELCRLITKIVISITIIENQHLTLEFDDLSKIQVPLNWDNPEIVGPEILCYTNVKKECLVI